MGKCILELSYVIGSIIILNFINKTFQLIWAENFSAPPAAEVLIRQGSKMPYEYIFVAELGNRKKTTQRRVLSSDVWLTKSFAFRESLMHFHLKNCLCRLRKMALNLPHKPLLQSTLLLVQSIPKLSKNPKLRKWEHNQCNKSITNTWLYTGSIWNWVVLLRWHNSRINHPTKLKLCREIHATGEINFDDKKIELLPMLANTHFSAICHVI